MYVGWDTKCIYVVQATIRFRREAGPLSILSEFRSLPAVIRELSKALLTVGGILEVASEVQAENGPALERLEELERSRAHWEAQIEAVLLKADSTLKSASNAEARSRTMLRHAEKLSDPLDFEGEELPAAVPEGDVPRGEEERLQPVRVGVEEITAKEQRLRMKFS